MKILWLIFTLVPAPFLFHFYEYGQYSKGEEPTFLLLGSIVFVVITGVLSGGVKARYIILVNVLTGMLSLLLATYFIANDGGWFTPFGRDFAIIFTTIAFLVGQLVVHPFSRKFIVKNKN
ncbi:hypothetical protein [Bacillus sp. FJAT-45037]|uniref:hypothetical protein n=1 Tax=Bacillus sp. FJAT-45037 TaxID=2011007 RepID=UPI000C24B8B8|nr:hypothetical protein [Bacillus sp. FJAT-45037]